MKKLIDSSRFTHRERHPVISYRFTARNIINTLRQ